MIEFSGFSDEAGQDIETQIRATKELGWHLMETRNVNGKNLTDITDAEFEAVCDALEGSEVSIHCFGSAVANWGKPPLVEQSFLDSKSELTRAISRMQKLGTKYIRGMSFSIIKDRHPGDKEIESWVFKNVGELVLMCEDAGIVYLHENCMNYGGQSWEHTLKLLENVQSPALKLVFDTGNPVHSWDRREFPPKKKQDPLEFYRNVKPFIEHVHIKDCIWQGGGEGVFDKVDHTFPGEGNGKVRPILTDLIRSGYDKVISIEPHIATVYHEGGDSREDLMFNTYLEYGRRTMSMVNDILQQ